MTSAFSRMRRRHGARARLFFSAVVGAGERAARRRARRGRSPPSRRRCRGVPVWVSASARLMVAARLRQDRPVGARVSHGAGRPCNPGGCWTMPALRAMNRRRAPEDGAQERPWRRQRAAPARRPEPEHRRRHRADAARHLHLLGQRRARQMAGGDLLRRADPPLPQLRRADRAGAGDRARRLGRPIVDVDGRGSQALARSGSPPPRSLCFYAAVSVPAARRRR